jgi:hypothetical protein
MPHGVLKGIARLDLLPMNRSLSPGASHSGGTVRSERVSYEQIFYTVIHTTLHIVVTSRLHAIAQPTRTGSL